MKTKNDLRTWIFLVTQNRETLTGIRDTVRHDKCTSLLKHCIHTILNTLLEQLILFCLRTEHMCERKILDLLIVSKRSRVFGRLNTHKTRILLVGNNTRYVVLRFRLLCRERTNTKKHLQRRFRRRLFNFLLLLLRSLSRVGTSPSDNDSTDIGIS